MPSLTDHASATTVKLMVAAHSGAGKTGAMACLVDAGFHLRILDFDVGLRPLRGYVKNRANMANVHYVELRDELKLTAGRIGIKKADAFQRAMDILDKGGDLWDKGSDIPPVDQWTSRDILVLDTLGMAGRASLQMVMAANGASLKAPELQHYGTAMDNIEKMIAELTAPKVPCHLIVNTHLAQLEGQVQLFPDALGSKLSPKIGRYFDNMITLSTTAGVRSFKTKKDGLFNCKTASPIAETYPIEDGLVKIFEALTGKKAAEIIATSST